MSYTEYFDLYYSAQKKDCKYRAFLIDVKNSKKCLEGSKYFKYHQCVDYITEELCKLKKINGKEVFLQNENNIKMTFQNYTGPSNNLIRNPMIVGDCACFFVNNNTITENQFIKIMCDAIQKFDVDFAFHYLSGQYETDDYAKGGKQLCKAYMLPIMEDLSKKQGLLIDKKCAEKLKNIEEML